MRTVAILGAVGGAGATSVAAHLAAALFRQGHDVLALDCCPDNRLRLYFGMSLYDETGWATEYLQGNNWFGAGYVDADGHEFVPFGQLADGNAFDQICARLRAQPQWLAAQIEALHKTPDAIAVCDCPRVPDALRDQAIAAADLILLVASPDSVSYSVVADLLQRAAGDGLPELWVVLNGFDASRRLDRDIALLLRSRHGQRFAPVVIHRDESVREALACKQTVFRFAPSCQAAHDYSALGTWTLSRLGSPVALP
ncbi:MAG TPA: cellulose biosynthesis protein BcsQ [Burkholderiaceae bacterium]|nr:cellulose biosynthesis protein BcsQ [Burkholderiaceae bacterium]